MLDWKRVGDMRKIEQKWYIFAAKHEDASFAYAKKRDSDCFSCADAKLRYVREYVKKVMRYNNSSNYAVGVLRLAYEASKNR